ncbi:MAG TPA: polymer-forming cytoskeletal protein, partial [Longimicrobiales bacterium]|nr:polymer-forming cytoskeletal protein [Longimicrobiales bacterium]
MIRSLLGRTDQLAELGEALEGLQLGDVQVRVGEDVRVESGSELDATLVAVDSDVEIDGTVRGDVVVVSGTLRIGEEGRVTGDVRLADSRLLRRDGTVEGSVTDVPTADVRSDVEARDRLREELRRELRNEIRSATRAARAERNRGSGWSLLSPLRAIGRGFAGLLGTLVNIVVLALLGWGVVFFAPDNLDVVAETARRSPGRSALVGMAGAFMLLPVWVLGGLALVLTVVGIFALPFWILLFPLAVAAATLLGLFAAASGVGEWLARRRFPFLDWVRSSNRYTLVAGGVIGLMVPFLLAHLVEMAVVLGFLEGLLTAAGWILLVAATCVGFGAVLLTRAGRRPEFYRGDPFDDEDWSGDFGAPAPGPSGDDWFGSGGAASTDAGTASGEAGEVGEPGGTEAEPGGTEAETGGTEAETGGAKGKTAPETPETPEGPIEAPEDVGKKKTAGSAPPPGEDED